MAQFDLVGMVVRDMAAALTFYRLIGLDIPPGQDGEPHVEITTANGCRLAWDTLELVRSIDPGWLEAHGQRVTLAFKCDNAAGVDALYAQAIAAGYHSHKAPWDAFWGQRYAVVQDPDGNLVDLFAPL